MHVFKFVFAECLHFISSIANRKKAEVTRSTKCWFTKCYQSQTQLDTMIFLVADVLFDSLADINQFND